MNSLISKVKAAIEKYNMLAVGDCVLVGLSGGADSTSLLHCLYSLRSEYGITVRAVHVNHGIRGENAERDSRFCEDMCARLGIELDVFRLDIPARARESGEGLEECGRRCRYEIFAALEKKYGCKTATAHTLSDSMETVLFNMTRGCGMSGLCGIPPVRGSIIRPLIMAERADVEEYCKDNGLDFVTDETNADTAYSRNLIRLEVVPRLKSINPDAAGAVGRMSSIIADELEFLERLANREADGCAVDGGFDLSRLNSLDRALRRRVLLIIIGRHAGICPQQKHIELLDRYISEGSGAVELNGRYTASVGQGILRIIEKTESRERTQWLLPFATGVTALPDGGFVNISVIPRLVFDECVKNREKLFKYALDYDIIAADEAVLRNRRDGDRIALLGRGCGYRVKKLLCDAHIPQDKRDSLLLLCCGDKCAWLEGFGAAEQFAVNENTGNVLTIDIERN